MAHAIAVRASAVTRGAYTSFQEILAEVFEVNSRGDCRSCYGGPCKQTHRELLRFAEVSAVSLDLETTLEWLSLLRMDTLRDRVLTQSFNASLWTRSLKGIVVSYLNIGQRGPSPKGQCWHPESGLGLDMIHSRCQFLFSRAPREDLLESPYTPFQKDLFAIDAYNQDRWAVEIREPSSNNPDRGRLKPARNEHLRHQIAKYVRQFARWSYAPVTTDFRQEICNLLRARHIGGARESPDESDLHTEGGLSGVDQFKIEMLTAMAKKIFTTFSL